MQVVITFVYKHAGARVMFTLHEADVILAHVKQQIFLF